MAVSGVRVGISGVGWGFQELSPHKPEKQGPRTERVGIRRSLGRGLGGNKGRQSWERERETFLPVKIGSSGRGGV